MLGAKFVAGYFQGIHDQFQLVWRNVVEPQSSLAIALHYSNVDFSRSHAIALISVSTSLHFHLNRGQDAHPLSHRRVPRDAGKFVDHRLSFLNRGAKCASARTLLTLPLFTPNVQRRGPRDVPGEPRAG
jgi:hypothetical protein